ncbi:MAG: HEAT repeat domain-containing protein [Isosphaeraceae bacterium]
MNTALPTDDETLVSALGDRSPEVRALALRRLPDRLVGPRLDRAAEDASAAVRAEALRRVSKREDLNRLLSALEDADPYVQQASREALKRLLGTEELAGLFQSDRPARRVGALLVLRESGRPDATRVLADALKDADRSVRFLAIQWVGEEKLAAFEPKLRESLESGTIDRTLFAASLAALERLEGRSRGPKGEVGGEEYVAALLSDPGSSPTVQLRALLALRPDHPAVTLEWLSRAVRSSDPEIQVGAVRTLRELANPGRFELLDRVAGDESWPVEARAEAVVGLGAAPSLEGPRRALLLSLATGKERTLRHEALRSLRGANLTGPERTLLQQVGEADPEASELLEAVGGWKTAARSKSEPLSSWLERLKGPADPAAGSRVFFHPKGPGCYRCHQVDGHGGNVGPDLTATGPTQTLERLIESVVNPSKEVAPQFAAHAVALKDGTTVTGNLVESTEAAHVYGDAEGKRIPVKPADIEEDRPLTTSIMPEDLPGLMTPQEFRDLVAFLRQSRSNAK